MPRSLLDPEDDPLVTNPPEPPEPSIATNEPCCDGRGWRQVGFAYAAKLLPEGATDEEIERLRSQTLFPCRRCRPGLFYRWTGGHLDPEHDRSSCEECREIGATGRGRKRSSRSTGPSMSTPERADLR